MSDNWLQEIYEKTPGVFTILIPADLQDFTKELIKPAKEHIKYVVPGNHIVTRSTLSIINWTEERLLYEILFIIKIVMAYVREIYNGDVVLVFTPRYDNKDVMLVCKAYSYAPTQS